MLLTSIPPTTHEYTLNLSKGSSFAAVKLHSWASSSSSSPVYAEGQCIAGQVELSLRNPDRIKVISVSVRIHISL